jgi:short-subunit dehydrogenase
MSPGKVALVTGGSAGIGLAVARKLVAGGTRVALIARGEKTLREAAAGLPGMAEIFPTDLMDLNAAADLPRRVIDKMGGLDVLINNAGLHHRGPMLEQTPSALADMVTVNLSAPIVLCRAAAPLMNAGGSIVNVASLAGMVPARFQATYGATKAGLRAFSKAIRQELRDRRIAVSVVSPGPVDTGFFGEEIERVADIVFSQPMSTAEEVADAVIACVREGRDEIAVPWLSGKLCTLGYVSPGLMRLLQPTMERRGARAKRAYIERKRGAR